MERRVAKLENIVMNQGRAINLVQGKVNDMAGVMTSIDNRITRNEQTMADQSSTLNDIKAMMIQLTQ
eukprot:4515995-Karenia_brevis.AAC.1